MKNKRFNQYYLFSCIGVLIASFYPLYMGVRVVYDMLADGTVMKDNYPKYIIPYTPICIGLLLGVLLMPLCFKLCRRFALLAGSAISTVAFFAAELLFENKVVVDASAGTIAKLEDWQMFMCYVPSFDSVAPSYKQQTPIEILMGDYNPAFKLHFYIISVILVLTVLNCIYGFGKMILSGDRSRRKSLIMQSAATAAFAGLCILACFTAFWRDGNLQVSPLSASLMTAFFIIFGMVGGIYVGSFTVGKRKLLSVWVPAVVASALTLVMYIGELILLHGHLYIFGDGLLFSSIPGIVLSPVDILIILASGGLTALVSWLINKKA